MPPFTLCVLPLIHADTCTVHQHMYECVVQLWMYMAVWNSRCPVAAIALHYSYTIWSKLCGHIKCTHTPKRGNCNAIENRSFIQCASSFLSRLFVCGHPFPVSTWQCPVRKASSIKKCFSQLVWRNLWPAQFPDLNPQECNSQLGMGGTSSSSELFCCILHYIYIIFCFVLFWFTFRLLAHFPKVLIKNTV